MKVNENLDMENLNRCCGDQLHLLALSVTTTAQQPGAAMRFLPQSQVFRRRWSAEPDTNAKGGVRRARSGLQDCTIFSI